MGESVRVIAKLKRTSGLVEQSENPSEDLPLLEPLVFLSDQTGAREGELYLQGLFIEDQQRVWRDGVVHQHWIGRDGNPYFTLIIVVDDPSDSVEDIPLTGFPTDLSEVFFDTHVELILCNAEGANYLPEIGSTVRVRGTYQSLITITVGEWRQIEPDNWPEDHLPRYILNVDTPIEQFSGSIANPEDHGKQWFDLQPEIIELSLVEMIDDLLNLKTLSPAQTTLAAADLHVYDSQNRHTGMIYDENDQVIDVEMQIPGSFHSGPISGQYILFDSINAAGYVYKIVQRNQAYLSLVLNLPTINDSLRHNVVLEDSITFDSDSIFQGFLNLSQDDSSSIILDSLRAKVRLDRAIWDKNWVNYPSLTFDVFIGNITNGFTIADIVADSITLNNKVYPEEDSESIINTLTGFKGKVLVVSFSGSKTVSSLSDDLEKPHYVTIDVPLINGETIHTGYVVDLVEKIEDPTGVYEESSSSYKFHLSQNYPNPFNPVTGIEYQLPEASHVRLVIYNLQGQIVKWLVDSTMPAGYYTVRWDGRNSCGGAVSSGVYLYRLTAGHFKSTKRMLLIR